MTFVVCWTVFLPVTPVVAPWGAGGFSYQLLFIPHSVLLPAVLALVRQFVVSAKITGETGRRIGLATASATTTLVCGSMMLLRMSLTSGMSD